MQQTQSISKGDLFIKGEKSYEVQSVKGQVVHLQDATNPESNAVFETMLNKLSSNGYVHKPKVTDPEPKEQPKPKAKAAATPKAEVKAKPEAVTKPKATPKPKAEAKPKAAPKAKPKAETDPRMKGKVKTEKGPQGAKPKAQGEPSKVKVGKAELTECRAMLATNIMLGEKSGGAMYPKGAHGWLVNLGGYAVFINEADYTIFEVTEKEVTVL